MRTVSANIDRVSVRSDIKYPEGYRRCERRANVTKRNLSLKVKGPCCAGTLFGGRFGRIANCSLEGRVRSSLACRSRQRLARKRSCGVPQLPRSAPALVTAVSEARTAATVLRGGQGGSRRCLPAPTPPLPPLASKASASSRTDLTARSLRERTNVRSIVRTRSNFRKHAWGTPRCSNRGRRCIGCRKPVARLCATRRMGLR